MEKIHDAIENGEVNIQLKSNELTSTQAAILRKKYGYVVIEEQQDEGDYHRSSYKTILWTISW